MACCGRATAVSSLRVRRRRHDRRCGARDGGRSEERCGAERHCGARRRPVTMKPGERPKCRRRAMSYRLGTIGGVKITARPSAIGASIALWAVATEVATTFFGASLSSGIVQGLIVTLLHWVSALLHQLGHVIAARRTGYPMSGLRLWFLLSSGLYPLDEPELPAATHVRRALGGPIMSLIVSVVAGVIALLMRNAGSPYTWIAVFAFLDNLLVFTLGAFLPLGFTDGSTLLRLWRARNTPPAIS